MTEKEINLFVIFLQKFNDKIGTDRLDRLLGRTIGTFHKQYDGEEEREHIIEDITQYISGGADYIDKSYEEDIEYEESLKEKRKQEKEVIEDIRKIFKFFR